MAAGAGDRLPALLAYAFNRPIPMATAADQKATRAQTKKRRSVRNPPGWCAVAFSDLTLFDCFSTWSMTVQLQIGSTSPIAGIGATGANGIGGGPASSESICSTWRSEM